jgi:quercetin dioxygenase-like cupin family protein
MRIPLALFIAAIPTLASAATDLAQLPGDTALHWGPAPAILPKGMTIAILSGNPDKPGPFTLRLRMPAGTTIAPHTHAQDENVTVLQGAIVHETGNTLDRTHGMALGTFGFVFLPADMPHSLWSTDGAEIQVSGTGPFGVHYINASDDPSKQR